MPIEEEPIVGATYEDEDDQEFEVTSFNEDDGTIGLLYTNGTAKEIDIDAWYEMELRRMKRADAWKESDEEYEDVEEEDGGDDEDLDDFERDEE